MKVALCQLNPLVGDLTGNAQKIQDAAARAHAAGADLAVCPELALCGYPPRDLLIRPSFIRDAMAALAALTVPVATIFGAPYAAGEQLFNAAILLMPGQPPQVFAKTLLPTYDVFDEARYFTPAVDMPPLLELCGQRLGISVCEDIWNDGAVHHYPRNPIAALAGADARVIINISASPFEAGKAELREQLVQDVARKHRIAVLYCNQVGGNDAILFDGTSLYVTEDARLVGRGARFAEDMLLCDLRAQTSTLAPALDAEAELAQALTLGIRDYAHKCGFRTAVIGLSGGIDSALTATLASDALGADNVFGVAMPSRYSSEHSLRDAEALAQNLGVHFRTLPIEPTFAALRTTLDLRGTPQDDLAEQNLQARIRGTMLMALANRDGHLLITTGNKSELATGYCTLYGDMCGGLAAISDLYKGQVYALSHWLNRERERIPQNTLIKPPSAELKPGQLDQDTLPPYDVLDAILRAYVDERKPVGEIAGDPALIRRIARMVRLSEYKRRQAAPGLKVSPQAFGEGRRYPLAQGYSE